MAIPSRNQDRGAPANGTFFVTSGTWERRPLFTDARMAEVFLEFRGKFSPFHMIGADGLGLCL